MRVGVLVTERLDGAKADVVRGLGAVSDNGSPLEVAALILDRDREYRLTWEGSANRGVWVVWIR